jgi:hypothetical protein
VQHAGELPGAVVAARVMCKVQVWPDVILTASTAATLLYKGSLLLRCGEMIAVPSSCRTTAAGD